MKPFSQSMKFLHLSIPALFVICFPMLAHAHVGGGGVSGLLHELAHFFSGLDHVPDFMLAAVLLLGMGIALALLFRWRPGAHA